MGLMRTSLFLLIGLVSFSACKTSGDLARNRGSEFVDPTAVVTADSAGGGQTGGASGDTEELQRQIEALKGQIEEEKVASQRAQEILSLKVNELQEVNGVLAAQLAAIKAGQTPEPVAGGADASGASLQGAEKLWKLAEQDLNQGKHESALKIVSDLVKTYPKDKLVFQALMLKGVLHYKLTQFSDAALAFNQVIDKFPKKKTLPMAWFGQGAAFAQMKRPEDSKIFFDELIRKFPQSTEAKKAVRIVAKKEKVPADLLPMVIQKNGNLTL